MKTPSAETRRGFCLPQIFYCGFVRAASVAGDRMPQWGGRGARGGARIGLPVFAGREQKVLVCKQQAQVFFQFGHGDLRRALQPPLAEVYDVHRIVFREQFGGQPQLSARFLQLPQLGADLFCHIVVQLLRKCAVRIRIFQPLQKPLVFQAKDHHLFQRVLDAL